MNRRISLGLAISLIIITATASFAITMTFSQNIYNRLLPALEDRAGLKKEVDELDALRKDFYGEIDQNNLTAELAEGYIKGLNDPYSYFMTSKEYAEYSDKLEGKIHGIGIIPSLDTQTGFIYLADVSPGSSAAAEGLQKGDEIINIAGEAVTAENYAAMTEKLEGMSLKTVTLTYRRDGADKTINVMIGYEAQSISFETVNDVGYIKINNFYKNAASQLENAIDKLKSDNVSSIIFDVRNTGEGSIEYAAKAIDIIVPLATEGNEAIATAKDKDGNIVENFTSDAKDITLPMAVLINAKTSGCAELFACDLHDFNKAMLIGDKTAGNDTMQKLFRLNDGSAVIMTVAKVYPYITETYDSGVSPDTGYAVSLTAEQTMNFDRLMKEDDTQFQKAFVFLTEGT